MGKKPKPLTIATRAHGALWSTPTRKSITSALGGLVLLGGAVKAAAEIWPYVEPIAPAHHAWVRDELAPIMMVQNTQAVSIDRFLLYQTQKELEATKADPGARTSPVVQDRIKSLEQQVKDTATRIHKATGGR